MDIFVEELQADAGWFEPNDPQRVVRDIPDMSHMSKTEKRAAQVGLITNNVRWFCLKLKKFVNGMNLRINRFLVLFFLFILLYF